MQSTRRFFPYPGNIKLTTVVLSLWAMKIIPLLWTSYKGEQRDNSSGNMYGTLASVFLAFKCNPVNWFNSLAGHSFEASLCWVLGDHHDLENKNSVLFLDQLRSFVTQNGAQSHLVSQYVYFKPRDNRYVYKNSLCQSLNFSFVCIWRLPSPTFAFKHRAMTTKYCWNSW